MFLDFEFNGEKASDYGLIVGSFNGVSDGDPVSSGADISYQQAKSCGSNKFHLYYSQYENSFTTTFQVIKNPCIYNNQEDLYFTVGEASSIQRWLCKRSGYYKFKIDDDEYSNIYWKATFSSKQINLNGRIIGLELTLITDAPYAYLDEVVIDIDCSSATDSKPVSFDIYDTSDEEGYIYPDMKITLLEGGTDKVFTLSNSMSNKITKISNCIQGETIVIDGTNQIITTDKELHKIGSNFNYLFPRIINTYTENKNTFTCNFACKITISYSPIRKIGI